MIPLGIARPKGATLTEYLNAQNFINFAVTSLERFKKVSLIEQ